MPRSGLGGAPRPGGRFPPAGPSSARARRGLTLLEVSVVMVVMLVAVTIFSNTVLSTSRQRALNRENAVAAEAARIAVEGMLNTPFELRFRAYNSDPADDPDGPGTAPGHRFAVAGLDPVPEALDGRVGEIFLPAAAAGGWLQLREDLALADLGLPRDLNGDFVVDERDHALDYVQLPVLVRLTWQGRGGRREFRLYTQMADYRW